MAVYQGSLTVKRRPKDGAPGNPGIPGLPGQVPIQKEWVVGDTHRFNDEIKDFIYVRGASSDTSYWYTRTSKGDDIVAGAAPVGGANVEGYTKVDGLRTLAVNVLLAEEANLANFIFKDGQLLSVRGTVNGVETNYSGQANFKPYIILDGKTGEIIAGGDKFRVRPDGSGQLAGGNIEWDTDGNVMTEALIKIPFENGDYSYAPTPKKLRNYIFTNNNDLTVWYLPEDSELNGVRAMFINWRTRTKTLRLSNTRFFGQWYSGDTKRFDIPVNGYCEMVGFSIGTTFQGWLITNSGTII